MATQQAPVCQEGPKWLKEVTKRKDVLAPLTGQDYAAYKTFLHALELYCYSDGEGRKQALCCMQHAVQAMQPSTRWIARETIPQQLDWDDREKLWPRILSPSGLCPPVSSHEVCA